MTLIPRLIPSLFPGLCLATFGHEFDQNSPLSRALPVGLSAAMTSAAPPDPRTGFRNALAVGAAVLGGAEVGRSAIVSRAAVAPTCAFTVDVEDWYQSN